jgi:DNA repair protein RadC
MELARRALAEEMKARDSLTSPAAVRGYLRCACRISATNASTASSSMRRTA